MNAALQEIATSLQLVVQEKNPDSLFAEIAQKVNELLLDDFNRLVSLLYRFDVSEEKLKQLLQQNPSVDAGVLIANLLIERAAAKTESRKNYQHPPVDPDQEAW